MSEAETYTLPSGLRIICAQRDSDVVFCGMAVDAGTRDELPHESGMAHFTEHLSFKGTHRRRAWHIINRMECVGGDLNAFTGKEETIYYCTALRPHLGRAIDLLVDVTLGSIYPQHEMDREVEVVIDEIESYNDSPSELIFDEFESILYQPHPLGRNILGEADSLRRLRQADVQRFARRLYHPSRMVLFVLGRVPMQQVVRQAQRALALTLPHGIPAPEPLPPRVAPAGLQPGMQRLHTTQMDTHQAHVMIGTQAFAATDARHLHMYLLNNILGGPSMNSRLNLALRERNGLVYTVESNLTPYTDTGVWSLYFGCDPDDVARCQRLALRELRRLTDAPLTPSALAAAKRQLQGQIGVSYDNAENVAIGMAKRYLHYGTTLTRQQLCQRIDALTAQDLHRTACQVFHPDRLITLQYR